MELSIYVTTQQMIIHLGLIHHRITSLLSHTVELNDIPAFLGHSGVGVSSEAFGDMIVDQFDVLYEEGATNARCMPICLHTFSCWAAK